MLQLKGGFLRTGRRSGGWMVPVRDLVAAHSPEAAGYHQRSQPELKLPAPRASPPQKSGVGQEEGSDTTRTGPFLALPSRLRPDSASHSAP